MATRSTRKSDNTESLERAFAQWKTVRELQLQYLEKLGTYKLTVAQADLVRAVSAGQWQTARMKASIATQLEQALQRLRHLRRQTERRQKRLDRQVRDVALVRFGHRLLPHQLTRLWAAYRVFQRAAPVSVLQTIAAAPVDQQARAGSNYADLRHPQRPCPDVPSDMENVQQLLDWLQQTGYMPRQGTKAYLQTIWAFQQLASVAQLQAEQLQQALEQLEQQTFDTWNPLVLAGLPDSIDVRRITRIDPRR